MPVYPPQPTRLASDMKKYRKLLLALAAIASVYIVRATGLDQGRIDAVIAEVIELVEEATADNK